MTGRRLPSRVSAVRDVAVLAALAGALLVGAGPVRAQAGWPVRLTVLTDSVSVGERVRIAVAVDHAPGRSVVFPDVPTGDAETGPLLSFGDAEAFSVRRLPPTVRGAVRTDSAVYEVAVFAIDAARVGPVEVRIAAGRDTTVLRTGVATVPVRSELTGETNPEPAPLGPPDPFPGLLPVWLALGALAAFVVGAVVWAVARWRRKPVATVPVAPYPEAVAALDGLGAPAETPDAAADQTLGAREALRLYLSRRLDVPALESTSDELNAALRADARVSPEAREATRRVLLLSDPVVYAGLRPSVETAAEARQAAQQAVDAVERAVATPAPPAGTATIPPPARPQANAAP